VIVEVHTLPKGPQVILSRTDPRLLMKLFETEVPEIYDGTVIIKNAVRAPGERAKVAVYSRERDVDPVGACVGMKGSRVQAIIRELRGEKIDIIAYSEDLVTFAQSALAPAKITRVSIKHEGEVPLLDVIVEDTQLSLAIGKRGQNVRLASELISCKIDIKSESAVKDEVADALAALLHVGDHSAGEGTPIDLTEAPGVGPSTAAKLEEAGFGTLEALVAASIEELTEVDGLGVATAEGLLAWASTLETEDSSDDEEVADEISDTFNLDSPAPPANTMDDRDFMAALNKAFLDFESTGEVGDEENEGVDEAPVEEAEPSPETE